MPTRQPIDRPTVLRPDENAVRLLFIEHSAEYGALVRAALDGATRAQFEICRAERLDVAARELDRFDALLIDLTASNDDSTGELDAASALASRLPVIVLKGNDLDGMCLRDGDDTDLRGEIARSRLPNAILRVVRRYRRLGQNDAAEPIVVRDPLRAIAPAFARLLAH